MSLGIIWSTIKREPVVILTLFLVCLSASAGLGWRQAVVVVGGLIARQFTAPASEVPQGPTSSVPQGPEVPKP